MESTGLARIPTRDRRQTMDWGLVLLSQGIAATIDDGADGSGWGLLVSAAEYPAAIQSLRLYRLENRNWRWHWRQPVAGFLFDAKAWLWAAFAVAIYLVSHQAVPGYQAAARMDNAAVRAGEWWRIFTAIFLHADVAHLASNVTLGLVLLGFVMGRYGSGTGLLAAYLAGAAGNVGGFLFYSPQHLGVGASGMVMGALGMLAAQSASLWRHNPISRKYVLRAALAGIMLFVLFGLDPETDVVAHFGGFSSGLLLGAMLLSLPPRWRNAKTDFAAAVMLGLLLGLTHSLAAFHLNR
ncbi:MAG TPA: rhomboid family intramembrane serine protease [Verrucomicrobiae bacterium]